MLRDQVDDRLRKVMLREPRGYPAANCNLILPATRPDADAGFVIMEQVEYPGMSGTNTICVVTVLLETGGQYSLAEVDPRVHKIVDFKCPSSGMSHANLWSNVDRLCPRD